MICNAKSVVRTYDSTIHTLKTFNVTNSLLMHLCLARTHTQTCYALCTLRAWFASGGCCCV